MDSTAEGRVGGTAATRTLYPVPVVRPGSTKYITFPAVLTAWDGNRVTVEVLAGAKLARVDI